MNSESWWRSRIGKYRPPKFFATPQQKVSTPLSFVTCSRRFRPATAPASRDRLERGRHSSIQVTVDIYGHLYWGATSRWSTGWMSLWITRDRRERPQPDANQRV